MGMTTPPPPTELRELDALIAEKVFGWTELVAGGGFYPHFGKPPGDKWNNPVPAFSSDPAAMMRVVERMGDYVFELLWHPSEKLWTAKFGMHSSFTEATAPLAVCRAALKAKGAKP